jgi:hypothetical protein
MAQVAPTNARNSDVYHNNDKCTERNNIEPQNLQQGTGGKRLCNRCAELNAAGV